MTVMDVYESGWPFLVIRVESNQPLDVARRSVEDIVGGVQTLSDIIEALERRGYSLAVSTSFAPSDWWSPATWGSYAWPVKTLLKEGLGDTRLVVVPARKGELGALLAATLYRGIGLVVERHRGAPGGEEVAAEPVAALVDAEMVPKKMVFIRVEPGARPGEAVVEAYTGDALAGRLLGEHGLREAGLALGRPPIRVYKKVIPAMEQATFLDALKRALEDAGITVYEHRYKVAGFTYLPAKGRVRA